MKKLLFLLALPYCLQASLLTGPYSPASDKLLQEAQEPKLLAPGNPNAERLRYLRNVLHAPWWRDMRELDDIPLRHLLITDTDFLQAYIQTIMNTKAIEYYREHFSDYLQIGGASNVFLRLIKIAVIINDVAFFQEIIAKQGDIFKDNVLLLLTFMTKTPADFHYTKKFFDIIIKADADINVQNPSRLYPLFIAAFNDNIPLIDYLLDNKAFINMPYNRAGFGTRQPNIIDLLEKSKRPVTQKTIEHLKKRGALGMDAAAPALLTNYKVWDLD